ncbi:MAG: ImmA/IrrE family metallo-endopeptidase [Bacilli bacterium]
MDYPMDRPSYIEQRIDALYRCAGVRSAADVSLYLWDAELRLNVRHRPGKTDVFQVRDSYTICVDAALPLPERRVEVAHEIGHTWLHAGNQLWLSPEIRAKQEHQAVRFSYYSLVPSYLLKQSLHGLPDCQGAAIAELAELFGVPEYFMAHRLELLI